MGSGASHPNSQTTSAPDSKKSVNRRAFWLACEFIRYDLRSYSLLTHFSDPQASNLLLKWETYAVTTEDLSIALPSGVVRARLYSPVGVARPHGLVAVPGIHRLGIDEPRLASLS